MQTVTLDALIPREDFDITTDMGNFGNTRNKGTLSIEDLKYDSFFQLWENLSFKEKLLL